LNYQEQLLFQVENANKPTAREFLIGLYSELSKELTPEGRYLEIGAGAGISSNFLGNYQITRTDILPWGDGLVLGGVNAERIPYQNNSFTGVFGMDMLHHMEFPYKVIIECLRVIEPEGKLMFIEPYVSLLSYPVYRIFHTEKTSLFKRIDPLKPAIDSNPEDGDQRICQTIFLSKSGKKKLIDMSSDKITIEVRFLHPLSFFLTGGLSKPLGTPSKVIKLVQRIERKLPNWFLRITASRMAVIVKLD
jgi:hypothetical protein